MRREWSYDEELYLINKYRYFTDKEIASVLNRSCVSVRKKRDRLGLYKTERYKVNEKFFKIWSSDMAYVLGYWFADGCMRIGSKGYRFEITSNDVEHLVKIKNVMNTNVKIYNRKDDNSNRIRITNKKIYNNILKLGGTPRKSLTAKFPYVPKEYVKDFIRGYFDGDGSIILRNYEPSITFVGTKQFLEKLENNLKYKGKLNKVSNVTWQLMYNAEYALEILDYLYTNKEGIKLERKYKKYLKAKNWKRQRKLRCDSKLLKLNGYPKTYIGVGA